MGDLMPRRSLLAEEIRSLRADLDRERKARERIDQRICELQREEHNRNLACRVTLEHVRELVAGATSAFQAERDAALARAEKAESAAEEVREAHARQSALAAGEVARLTKDRNVANKGCDDLLIQLRGACSTAAAAEAREAALRAKVEALAKRWSNLNGAYYAECARYLRAILAPAGERKEPRVTDPAGAPTMPCPHHPPCPLLGTRYGEGYCVARSQHGKEPTDG